MRQWTSRRILTFLVQIQKEESASRAYSYLDDTGTSLRTHGYMLEHAVDMLATPLGEGRAQQTSLMRWRDLGRPTVGPSIYRNRWAIAKLKRLRSESSKLTMLLGE